jgi:hypothetical protein
VNQANQARHLLAMNPRLLQTIRQLHHAVARRPPLSTVEVRAGAVLDLINAFWGEVQRADRLEAAIMPPAERDRLVAIAERNLDQLRLGLEEPACGPLFEKVTPPAGVSVSRGGAAGGGL